jgi:hypothetical protein
MGCGCARKIARNKRKSQKSSSTKNKVVRKRRISKLVSISGTPTTKRRVKSKGSK